MKALGGCGWHWWPGRELVNCFSRGGEIKSLSSTQFGSPLMYCGVSIHATWTVSSEGLHEEQEQALLKGCH